MEKYSQIPFYLLNVTLMTILIFGKDIPVLSAHFGHISVRLPQLLMITLLLLTIPLYKQFTFSARLALLLFVIIGMFASVKGLLLSARLQFVLANAGIIYYISFFYIAFVLINTEQRIYIFLKVLFLAWFIGVVFFIFQYFFGNNYQLPYKIHLSSDLLPLLASGILILYLSLPHSIPNKKLYLLVACVAPVYLLLVMTKGSILAGVIALLFYRYLVHGKKFISHLNCSKLDKNLWIALLIIILMRLVFSIYYVKCYDKFYEANVCENVDCCSLVYQYLKFPEENKLKNNHNKPSVKKDLLYRFYIWKDTSRQIVTNDIAGHGIVPLNAIVMKDKIIKLGKGFEYLGINPHNSYLWIAFLIGTLGFIVFLYIQYRIFTVACRINQNDQLYHIRAGLYCAALTFIIAAMATPVFELYYVAPIFWILVGAACGLSLRVANEIGWVDGNETQQAVAEKIALGSVNSTQTTIYLPQHDLERFR